MWLRDPARIEGLLACEFIALLISALIERQLRNAMKQHDVANLAVYPEDRTCTAPPTPHSTPNTVAPYKVAV